LVIGAVAGAYWTPPRLVLASALAFASGALITALAFDLFQESFERGAWLSAIGLLAGAATFVAADELLDRYIQGAGSGISAFALLAGVTLDGVPENMALGVSLLEISGAGALTLLVAIFFSNLPEALGGAVGMRQQGRSRRFAIGLWSATAVVLAAAVVLGNVALSRTAEGPLAVLLSFAGGGGARLTGRYADARRLQGGRGVGCLRHGCRLPDVVSDRGDIAFRVSALGSQCELGLG
jgi:ZIP family zinc transporter